MPLPKKMNTAQVDENTDLKTANPPSLLIIVAAKWLKYEKTSDLIN